jgi:hypothetical protein
MVVVFLQACSDASDVTYRPYWDAVSGNIVRSLDVEGLFDFGVRSNEEMEDYEGGDEEIEKSI